MVPLNITALELWAEKPQGLFEPLTEILLEIISKLHQFSSLARVLTPGQGFS